jgi:LPXTG-motif cell wall-anchored protein
MTKQFVKKSVPVLVCSALLFSAAPVSAEEHSVEDIIENSREAMNNLESISARTEIEFTYESGLDHFVDYHEFEEDIFSSPFMLRGSYTSIADSGEETNWGTYSTEDAYYTQDIDGTWLAVKEGDEGFERPDFTEIMHQWYFYEIDEFAAEFSLSEEDETYILTYESEGGTYEDVLEPSSSEDLESGAAGLNGSVEEDYEITDLFFEVHIDKETYYLKDTYKDFYTSYTYDGVTTDVREVVWTNLYNHNSVEPFEVPAEVVEGALSYDEYYSDYEGEYAEDEHGDELPATASDYPFYVLAGLLTVAAAGGMLVISRRKNIEQNQQ